MGSCIIFGGAGYIGTKLIDFFLENQYFESIYVADIKQFSGEKNNKIISYTLDIRSPIELELVNIEWIFNFAAIHREPGHSADEYFVTNIKGAGNVCEFARKVNCNNVFFTSSISVYGPTLTPTSEDKLTTPDTPYGISKIISEHIHREWLAESNKRKLIIVRPGVIYGPGDPGNIMRMIRAIKKGYFFLPVTPDIKKSYGYIYGLIDSISFTMKLDESLVIYNYVEKDTEPIGSMIQIVKRIFGVKAKAVRIPFLLLKTIANIIHKINPNINGIHPERVAKVARPTHIVPQILIDKSFMFNYDFQTSLKHWMEVSPHDFKV